ncbi:MAG: hypothetical protein M1812_008518, partial [Candelaria pacifica]
VNEKEDTESDHEIIQFSLLTGDTEFVESSFSSPFNVNKADWKLFEEDLKREEEEVFKDIQSLLQDPQESNLERAAVKFKEFILKATQDNIPLRRKSPQAKVWWNDNLSGLRKTMSIVKRHWKRERSETL